MNIINDWQAIKKHVSASFRASLHVSIATVNKNNIPSITPIGTLFLNNNQTGFYFEKFSAGLTSNVENNNKVCVLAVNSNRFFWLKSLFYGKFKKHPALKMYGELGIKRKATPIEKQALARRMRFTKSLKGNQYLWSDMQFVREIRFDTVESMKLGKMIPS